MASRPHYAVGAHEVDGVGSFLLIAVYRGSRMVALAPCAVRRILGIEVVRLLGHGRGVVREILAEDRDAARVLWAAVADRGLAFNADLVLGSDLAMSTFLEDSRWERCVRVRDSNMAVDVPEGVVPADIRSSRSLKRLRSYRSALARSGSSLGFETVTTAAELDRRWAEMTAVAEVGTAGRGRVNFLGPPNEEFVRRFLGQEAEAGRLFVLGLVIDGKWCAHDISVRVGRRLEGWLTHYLPECAQTQPGHQLMEWLVAHRDELAVDQLDMGVGHTELKLAWANNIEPVLTITAVDAGRFGASQVVRAIDYWELGTVINRLRHWRHALRAAVRQRFCRR